MRKRGTQSYWPTSRLGGIGSQGSRRTEHLRGRCCRVASRGTCGGSQGRLRLAPCACHFPRLWRCTHAGIFSFPPPTHCLLRSPTLAFPLTRLLATHSRKTRRLSSFVVLSYFPRSSCVWISKHGASPTERCCDESTHNLSGGRDSH